MNTLFSITKNNGEKIYLSNIKNISDILNNINDNDFIIIERITEKEYNARVLLDNIMFGSV